MMNESITETSIQNFIKSRLATEINLTVDKINVKSPIASYRLDSVIMVTLAADLEEWLNCPIDSSIFWQFDTIADVSAWLVNDYLPTQRS